eukprot:Lankesteria_metandrocarpae@DN4730_c0_g1_i3.p1
MGEDGRPAILTPDGRVITGLRHVFQSPDSRADLTVIYEAPGQSSSINTRLGFPAVITNTGNVVAGEICTEQEAAVRLSSKVVTGKPVTIWCSTPYDSLVPSVASSSKVGALVTEGERWVVGEDGLPGVVTWSGRVVYGARHTFKSASISSQESISSSGGTGRNSRLIFGFPTLISHYVGEPDKGAACVVTPQGYLIVGEPVKFPDLTTGVRMVDCRSVKGEPFTIPWPAGASPAVVTAEGDIVKGLRFAMDRRGLPAVITVDGRFSSGVQHVFMSHGDPSTSDHTRTRGWLLSPPSGVHTGSGVASVVTADGKLFAGEPSYLEDGLCGVRLPAGYLITGTPVTLPCSSSTTLVPGVLTADGGVRIGYRFAVSPHGLPAVLTDDRQLVPGAQHALVNSVVGGAITEWIPGFPAGGKLRPIPGEFPRIAECTFPAVLTSDGHVIAGDPVLPVTTTTATTTTAAVRVGIGRQTVHGRASSILCPENSTPGLVTAAGDVLRGTAFDFDTASRAPMIHTLTGHTVTGVRHVFVKPDGTAVQSAFDGFPLSLPAPTIDGDYTESVPAIQSTHGRVVIGDPVSTPQGFSGVRVASGRVWTGQPVSIALPSAACYPGVVNSDGAVTRGVVADTDADGRPVVLTVEGQIVVGERHVLVTDGGMICSSSAPASRGGRHLRPTPAVVTQTGRVVAGQPYQDGQGRSAVRVDDGSGVVFGTPVSINMPVNGRPAVMTVDGTIIEGEGFTVDMSSMEPAVLKSDRRTALGERHVYVASDGFVDKRVSPGFPPQSGYVPMYHWQPPQTLPQTTTTTSTTAQPYQHQQHLITEAVAPATTLIDGPKGMPAVVTATGAVIAGSVVSHQPAAVEIDGHIVKGEAVTIPFPPPTATADPAMYPAVTDADGRVTLGTHFAVSTSANKLLVPAVVLTTGGVAIGDRHVFVDSAGTPQCALTSGFPLERRLNEYDDGTHSKIPLPVATVMTQTPDLTESCGQVSLGAYGDMLPPVIRSSKVIPTPDIMSRPLATGDTGSMITTGMMADDLLRSESEHAAPVPTQTTITTQVPSTQWTVAARPPLSDPLKTYELTSAYSPPQQHSSSLYRNFPSTGTRHISTTRPLYAPTTAAPAVYSLSPSATLGAATDPSTVSYSIPKPVPSTTHVHSAMAAPHTTTTTTAGIEYSVPGILTTDNRVLVGDAYEHRDGTTTLTLADGRGFAGMPVSVPCPESSLPAVVTSTGAVHEGVRFAVSPSGVPGVVTNDDKVVMGERHGFKDVYGSVLPPVARDPFTTVSTSFSTYKPGGAVTTPLLSSSQLPYGQHFSSMGINSSHVGSSHLSGPMPPQHIGPATTPVHGFAYSSMYDTGSMPAGVYESSVTPFQSEAVGDRRPMSPHLVSSQWKSTRIISEAPPENEQPTEIIKYVEVPVIQEVVRHVPGAEEIIEIERKVPRVEVEYIERLVEVVDTQYVDRVVEVEEFREVTKYVSKVQVIQIPKEIIVTVPKIIQKTVEKTVEVPGEIIEVPKPYIVEQKVTVPQRTLIEVPTVVAQSVRSQLEIGEIQIEYPARTLEPKIIPVH